jgi:L-threonylcarbamoyladenylate synthase
METQVLDCCGAVSRDLAIAGACEILASGGVVAVPAETVYGLAGDALNPSAAARIFEAKERPFFDPLICHLPDLEWLEKMTSVPASMAPLVSALVKAFWPGPLTLVLPKSARVPDIVCSGLPTVALRWSAHPVFQQLLTRFGRPLAAPSANRFGRISPTSAEHVRRELAGRIPLILDAGASAHGVESTIVAPSEGGMRILRSGPVTREQLETFAPVLQAAGAGVFPEAPGQLKSHYAPRTPMHLLEDGEEVSGSPENCGLLAWRRGRPGFASVEVLSSAGDKVEAAAALFAAMRRLDESGVAAIYAERVPPGGLAEAINDRLQRAAAR